MVMNRIQFQKGLSLPEFVERYGTEAKCEKALELARWPKGFKCPRCHGTTYCVLQGRGHPLYQCNHCHHQTSLTAGTVFQATKLPLTTWFLAIYLISEAKTGISALALKRQLGVSYPTAWLVYHKLMRAMVQREGRYTLSGHIQIDDAYLGGEHPGGKAGRGSENKVAFVAAVSLTDDGHPLRTRLTPVAGFTSKAIADWAKAHIAPGSRVSSDGLNCFPAVTASGCLHEPTVMAGRKPRDVPEFRWINTVLGNLKTSLAGSHHAFGFRKYADLYLGAFSYRFNRRFDLRALPERLLIAAVSASPHPLRAIRVAEAHC